jgi:4-hydroxyproline epimerase
MQRTTIRVIDSHTAGEPTRVIVDGGPDLGDGRLAERRERFRREFDHYRSAVVHEPRGSSPVVGALLCQPNHSSCTTGVIFFNNVGYLGMCGHGTIGVIATLAHLDKLSPGSHNIETPVGIVTAELHQNGEVSVENVPSYRHAKDVTVDAPPYGRFTGDVAYGGNWFFLVESSKSEPLVIDRVDHLTELTWAIRQALAKNGITGHDGAEIDHVELFAPTPHADSRNFVLCPGKAYDRSPCGTGTCAKLACLFEDGKIAEGQVWRQESIVGSHFDGWVRLVDGVIRPTIRGAAHVNGEATLIIDERDPFRWGIR